LKSIEVSRCPTTIRYCSNRENELHDEVIARAINLIVGRAAKRGFRLLWVVFFAGRRPPPSLIASSQRWPSGCRPAGDTMKTHPSSWWHRNCVPRGGGNHQRGAGGFDRARRISGGAIRLQEHGRFRGHSVRTSRLFYARRAA